MKTTHSTAGGNCTLSLRRNTALAIALEARLDASIDQKLEVTVGSGDATPNASTPGLVALQSWYVG
jgi:hypothetical protein